MANDKKNKKITRQGLKNIKKYLYNKKGGLTPADFNAQGTTLHHQTAEKLAIKPEDFFNLPVFDTPKNKLKDFSDEFEDKNTIDWDKMGKDVLEKLNKLSTGYKGKDIYRVRKPKAKRIDFETGTRITTKINTKKDAERRDPFKAIHQTSEYDQTIKAMKSFKLNNGKSFYEWAKSGKKNKDAAPPVIMTIVGQKCFLTDLEGKLLGDPGTYFRGTAGSFLEPGTWVAMPKKQQYLRLEDKKVVSGFTGQSGIDRGLINYFVTSPSSAIAINELTRGRSLFVRVVKEGDKMAKTNKDLKISAAFIRSFQHGNLGDAFKEIGKYFAELNNAPEYITTTIFGFSRFGYFLMLPLAKDLGNAVAVAKGAETSFELDVSAKMFSRLWGAMGVGLFLSIAKSFISPKVMKVLETRAAKGGYKPLTQEQILIKQAGELKRILARDIEPIWRASSKPYSETDVVIYRGCPRSVGKHARNPIGLDTKGGKASRDIVSAQDSLFNQYAKNPVFSGPKSGQAGIIEITIPKEIWNEMVRKNHISERTWKGFSGKIESTELRINSKEAAQIINRCKKRILKADANYDLRPLGEKMASDPVPMQTKPISPDEITREIKIKNVKDSKTKTDTRSTSFVKAELEKAISIAETDTALSAWRSNRGITGKEFKDWILSRPHNIQKNILDRLNELTGPDSVGNRNFILRDIAHEIRINKDLKRLGIKQEHGDFAGPANKSEKAVADSFSSTKSKAEDPNIGKYIEKHNIGRKHHQPVNANDYIHQALDIFDAINDPLRRHRDFGYQKRKIQFSDLILKEQNPLKRKAMETVQEWKSNGSTKDSGKKLIREYRKWFKQQNFTEKKLNTPTPANPDIENKEKKKKQELDNKPYSYLDKQVDKTIKILESKHNSNSISKDDAKNILKFGYRPEQINQIISQDKVKLNDKQITNLLKAELRSITYLKDQLCKGSVAETIKNLEKAGFKTSKAIRNRLYDKKTEQWKKANPDKLLSDIGSNKLLHYLEDATKEADAIKNSLREKGKNSSKEKNASKSIITEPGEQLKSSKQEKVSAVKKLKSAAQRETFEKKKVKEQKKLKEKSIKDCI
jgi:hypothetical protein